MFDNELTDGPNMGHGNLQRAGHQLDSGGVADCVE